MSADGRIRIAIEVDGKQVEVASKELDKLENAGERSGKGIKEAEDSLKGVGDESQKASGKIKKFVTAIGLVAIGTAAFNALRNSLDSAIKRFDTLNTFPKVLQELGVSAKDSQKAMQKLSDGIDGLPTTLDEIASSAQRMYTSFNDIDKATDTALALNNALLGSGSSAEDAKRGTEQYIQALQRGKFEMEEWKTLQETMDVGLIKIAESFGYTGRTAKQDLYNALKEGIITMDQFNDKLIEVGTGTGIMAKLAKENSLGLSTSLSNLRNAFARGVANILDSLNKLSVEATGKDIAQNIDSLKAIVNASFKTMGNVIEATAPIVKGFIFVLEGVITVLSTLKPAILGAVSAYAALVIINKVRGWIQSANAVVETAIATQKALTLAKRADVAATVAQNGALKLSTLLYGVLTGRIKAQTAATIALAAAKKLLSGPIGWVTIGIGALAGAVVGIVKWFKRETEEAKRLKAETEKLSKATDKLTDSVKQSEKAYQDNQKDIKSTAKANEELVKRIDELAKKENKSAADKYLLSKYVEQLNGSIEGLNLAYDENADALSMSTEQLKNRVGLMKEEESLIAAQERLLEIDKERNEVEMQLEEINKLRDEWNKKLEEGSVKASEHKEEIAKLDEQEKKLTGTLNDLSTQQSQTEAQIKASTEAITEAVKNGVNTQILDYERLKEKQKEIVDSMASTLSEYKDTAEDMFDTLSDKVELTAGEMKKNMEENQRIISEWAENIATLAERGLDEGLLNKLREAGPESAGHVKALVQASDKELAQLNDVFRKAGEVAKDSMAKVFDIEGSDLLNSITNMVSGAKQSLREQIQSANFEELGFYIPEGTAKGIKEGTPSAEKAAEQMAKGTEATFRRVMGIKSPSRVFRGFGVNITEGLALGITEGSSKVQQAINRIARNLVNANKKIPSEFKNIGIQAMNGLNDGLNAGKDKVLATAKNIANQLTSTMQSALKIQSPSKVMRDKVGKWISKGIAEGIEENASSVYRALKKLSYATPEASLGTYRMVYSNANLLSDGGNRTFTNNPFVKPQLDITGQRIDTLISAIRGLASRPVSVQIDGREFVYATVDEMDAALKFKDGRIKSFK